ncbi:MAG: hypothetical protein AB7N73_07410 [Gemmatimonadales bacterium]
MPPGDSWFKGASRLFVDLATPSPQLVEAMAVVGSNLSTPISTVLRTAEVLGKSEDAAFLLRPSYAVLAGGGGTSSLARACVGLAFDSGHLLLAHECARIGMARGEDSTWFAIRLAHLAAIRRDTVAVSRWFELAARAAATERAATTLLWHLEPHRRGERLADSAPGRLPSTWAEAFALISPRARVDWLRQRAVELDSLVPPSAEADYTWVAPDIRASFGSTFRPPTPAAWPSALVLHFHRVAHVGDGYAACTYWFPSRPCWVDAPPEASRLVTTVRATRWEVAGPIGPAGVVTLAVPLRQPAIEAQAGARLPAQVRISCDEPGRGWRDTLVAREYVIPDRVARDANLIVRFPLGCNGSISAWSVVLQVGDAVGGGYDEFLAPPDDGGVFTSDLALGGLTSDQWIVVEGDSLPLLPTGVFDRAGLLEVAARVDLVARSGLDVTLRMSRLEERTGRPRAALEVEEDGSSGVVGGVWRKTLSLQALRPGWYELTLEARSGTLRSARAARFQLVN